MNSYRLKAELQTRFHCFMASQRDVKAPVKIWGRRQQTISVNAFNLNERLYFKRLSFIKRFKLEIVLGVGLIYMIRLF